MDWLAYDGPTAVRLAAGNTVSVIRPALDIGDLAETGAAEAIGIIVIAADTEFAAIVVAGIAPLIIAGPPCIEAVVIGLVGIAAVLAVHVSGQRRAHRTAD